MIIEANDTLSGFKKAKEYLLSLDDSLDTELLKESPMLLVFKNLNDDKNIPDYNGMNFKSNFEYPDGIDLDLVNIEFAHYEKLLNKEVSSIIEYLKINPFSKRAIVNVWTDNQKDLASNAECLIYINLRKCTNGLDMHIHMRANDATNKALLNFHIFSSLHRFIANSLSEKVGTYFHYSNSYHIYR